MDESVEQMLTLYPHLRAYRVEELFRHPHRQLEFLCVRALLAELTSDTSLTIDHEQSGKPILKDYFVSISHTKGYAALILSRKSPVAIDIEKISVICDAVAERYIRTDEVANCNTDRLLVWSAKESLYKYFSEEHLEYYDMRIMINANAIAAENLKSSKSVSVSFELSSDYVLTFILPQP